MPRGARRRHDPVDDKRLIRTALPDFDAERIAVGQWGHDVERAWGPEFVVPGGPAG